MAFQSSNSFSPASLFLAAVVVLSTLSQGCAPRVEPVDLVLRGGKIATVDEAQPYAEALAVRGDTLVAVGSNDEMAAFIGEETRVLELEGRLAIPGFIEGHGHFLGVGLARMQLNLNSVQSWDEVIALVAAAVEEASPGDWIEGRGWHQEKWTTLPEPNVQGLPTHHSLSAISPDNPVVLRHASGHAVFANAKAMELGGVNADTTAPEGGEILLDAAGEPIGVFRETAGYLVSRKSPRSEDEMRRQVELASEECLAKGITSFQDAGSSFEEIDLIKSVADEGGLRLRLWMMVRDSSENLRQGLASHRWTDHANGFLSVGGIKHSIDGALGSHGAWLLEPYTDLPESTGLNTTALATIEESAQLALEHGYQLCVHAIGDRANRETLDIFEAAYEKSAGKELRWRVEHAQHLNPEEIPRFGELGVIASMQAVHCTSDGPWVPTRLGEERAREGAYLWRTLLDSGVVVTNGTDAPVEDVSALASYTSSVTRRMNNGEVFYGDQVMTREEALEAYTLSAAFAAFEEDSKGSLSPGKLADITVLSQDILTVPDEELPATEVVYTIVGGKVEYQRD
ncbi:MAG: amidohydrolase [Deltaproteobacteria bacterium]|nr:amidohydrolase [Deltaproteobacteria bacterium]